MKVHAISRFGEVFPLAYALKRLGHDVTLYNAADNLVGDGLIPFHESLTPPQGTDLCLLGNGLMCKGDVPTIGATVYGDRLLSDEAYVQNLLQLAGIPRGELRPVDMAIYGWFHNGELCEPAIVAQVMTKFLPGNLGPFVGFAGCMGKLIPLKSKLVDITLRRLESMIKLSHYTGVATLDFYHEGGTLYARDVSLGLLPEAYAIMAEAYVGDFADFLMSKPTRINEDWIGALKLSVVAYPYIPPDPASILISGYYNDKHIWLLDVLAQGNELAVAGISGAFALLTAHGTSPREVKRRIMRAVADIHVVPDIIQYRNDLGSLTKVQAFLQERPSSPPLGQLNPQVSTPSSAPDIL